MNAMKLKDTLKKLGKEKNIPAQLLLQNYALERFLERISVSKYKENIILKGGLLIANIFDAAIRSTMDMDVTLKKVKLEEQQLYSIINTILAVKINDGVIFELQNISPIRDDSQYSGYRVVLKFIFSTIKLIMKVDITSGDIITPREIEYKYNLLLEDRSIGILSYTPETIIAEKIEAIVSRGNLTTRLRDYYDMYIFIKLYKYDKVILKNAIINTCTQRNTLVQLNDYEETLLEIKTNKEMNRLWLNYCKTYQYANGIELDVICGMIIELLDCILNASVT